MPVWFSGFANFFGAARKAISYHHHLHLTNGMNWTPFLLNCGVALIGGCLGAALSGLGGFVLFGLLGSLGFLLLLGAHDNAWINAITGSPLLKPSVCFLGGVIATAYARRQGLIQCGKDIGRSFISYRRFDILAVGGVAGLSGYLINQSVETLLSGRVDTIALTVFALPLFIKYHWRMTKTNDCEASSHAVPSPYRFFEKFTRPLGKTLVACVVGLCTPLVTTMFFLPPETRPYAGLPVFFLSAVSLFPLFMGIPIPATHHFSGPAGAVALLWLSLHGVTAGPREVALVTLWGVTAAQVSVLAGGVMEKLFFTEGDIHIDPPAMGILVSTAVMLGGLSLTGIYSAGPRAQCIVALSILAAALIFNVKKKHA